MLDLFNEPAKLLIDKYGGNKDKALKACLAYMSGHYQKTLVGRSLLSGQEKITTIEVTLEPLKRRSAIEDTWTFLRDIWPPKLTEILRGMRARKDQQGVVFDIWEDRAEHFLSFYEDFIGKNPESTIKVAKSQALPDLEEDEDD